MHVALIGLGICENVPCGVDQASFGLVPPVKHVEVRQGTKLQPRLLVHLGVLLVKLAPGSEFL